MTDTLTTTIGNRIAAHGLEVHDIADQLMTNGQYPLLAPTAWRVSAVHYTAAQRGIRSLEGDIASWYLHSKHHVRTNGWPGIAYAIGASQSGRVFLLRGVLRMGYHCFSGNDDALGISADMGVQQATPALLASLEVILRVLHEETPELPHLTAATTFGHRELTFLDPRNGGTECPGTLLPHVQRYRAGADFDGQGGAGMPDANDAALEELWLSRRHIVGEKRVPGAGELARAWGGDKVLLCDRGVLAAADGVAWDCTQQSMDDLVSAYWPQDGSLTVYS